MSSKDVVQIDFPEDFISLRMGQPSLKSLPFDIMQEASNYFFSKGDPSSFQYGNMQGNTLLRENLSDFLTDKYEMSNNIHPDNLVITHGASYGLDILCTLFTKSGDTVLVEDPTYFLVSLILKNHKLNVVSIPTDLNGMRIDILEEKIKQYKPAFIYTIPTFQNPSSITIPKSNRIKMIETVEKYNTLLIADEVYHLLKYTGNIPKPFPEYSDSKKVISLGSFSKILAPGLRLGWIQSRNKEILKEVVNSGVLFSSGGMNPFVSALVQNLIELGLLDKYIKHLKIEYLQRMNTLASSLEKHLAKYVEFNKSIGGYYIWAKLKNKVSSVILEETAKKYKVSIMPGSFCSVEKNFEDYMRLSISYNNSEKIEEGIKRLQKAFQDISD